MQIMKAITHSILFSLACFTLQAQQPKSGSSENTFDSTLPPLVIEETGNVEVLPDVIPTSWMFIDDASFPSMFGGKLTLLDVAEKTLGKRIKGITDKNLMGGFIQAKTRSEFYIIESFHERGSRGPKVDVLTIYDKKTMSPIKEILWNKTRLSALPRRHAMTFSKNERFLFVANFSPAGSFTVVDLDTKEITEDIGTPGCVLTFPTGKNSVTSMCSNGGLLTTVIDDSGHMKSQHRIAPFFDTDKSPIFERPTIIDGIAYFPGFHGELHQVDLTNEIAKYKKQWSLLTNETREGDWRPGGLALNDSDESGLYYIIMSSKGFDGSQTHGGSEVWVFDVKKKERINVISVPNWAISLALTRGETPLLVVTNASMNLDVFNPRTGELVQTISDFGQSTPLVLHKAY